VLRGLFDRLELMDRSPALQWVTLAVNMVRACGL
jgi:hypothetical protein